MAWIESHQTLREHPKLYKLMDILKIEKPQAIGHLHMFWWWCVDYALEGSLGTYNDTQIARAAEWSGEAKTFVSALIESGFIDRKKSKNGKIQANPSQIQGFLLVHDWMDFCGDLVTKRIERQDGRRKKRQTNPDKPPQTGEKGEEFPPTNQPNQPTVPYPNQPTANLIEIELHISKTFQLKKQVIFPFTDLNREILKALCGLYSESQIKALWDVFLAQDSDWIKKTGYTIREFQRQIPVLLENPKWKELDRVYCKNETGRKVDVKLKAIT